MYCPTCRMPPSQSKLQTIVGALKERRSTVDLWEEPLAPWLIWVELATSKSVCLPSIYCLKESIDPEAPPPPYCPLRFLVNEACLSYLEGWSDVSSPRRKSSRASFSLGEGLKIPRACNVSLKSYLANSDRLFVHYKTPSSHPEIQSVYISPAINNIRRLSSLFFLSFFSANSSPARKKTVMDEWTERKWSEGEIWVMRARKWQIRATVNWKCEDYRTTRYLPEMNKWVAIL